MCVKLVQRATANTWFQGYKWLALWLLAYSVDEDSLYWPQSWAVQDAELQRDGVYAMIRALEQAGEIVFLGAGPARWLWITIAFTPREMKDIAMRRFQTTDREAAVFVSGIVSRQIN